VGWGFALIFALQAPAILANAMAWRRMLPPEHRAAVPLTSLAAAMVSGDAVNAVTPTAVVAGSVVRVGLLRRRVPTATAVGSTTLGAMTQFSAQVLFVLSGIPVVLGLTSDQGLRTGLYALFAMLCLALGLVLGLAWSPGIWKKIEGWLDRIAWWRRLRAGREESWTALADATLGTLRRRPRDFVLSVALYTAGWLVGAVEARLILSLLHVPVTWRQAFSIEALSVAIEAILFFVPAKMGTQEGGKYVIFAALQLDPTKGFALGFVRRLRELAWAAVGLGLYGFLQRHPVTGTEQPRC
jgi:hypothetical protein